MSDNKNEFYNDETNGQDFTPNASNDQASEQSNVAENNLVENFDQTSIPEETETVFSANEPEEVEVEPVSDELFPSENLNETSEEMEFPFAESNQQQTAQNQANDFSQQYDKKDAFYQNQNYTPNNPQQRNPHQGYYHNVGNQAQQPQHQAPNFSAQTVPNPPKSKKGCIIAAGVLAVCVVIAFLSIFSGLMVSGDKDDVTISMQSTAVSEQNVTSAPTITTPSQPNTNSLTPLSSVQVADKVRPSVVGVMVYNAQGQLREEGSGVIISENNGYTYVITCAHVIEDANAGLSIMMLDGNTYEAEVIGADETTDIGVVRVQMTGLPIIEIGDSTSLKIGEVVYAVGNPGGSEFFGSITDGIVSSIDRSISSAYNLTSIQHNAAINPGNSGGALVNSYGQLVGINSSKIADTDFEGMGFAVPTTISISIAQSLIDYGYVPNRPKLGIEYASINSYQLYSLVATIKGLPQGSLVIAGISDESSLTGTNAQVGDLIIGVNGAEMKDSSVLLDYIQKGNVGDQLTLNLCRIESGSYKITKFDVTITLVEDKGPTEPTTQAPGEYNYGGSNSFEDFFSDYFGF